MAITSAVCTSFKQELAQEAHDFDNDTFKVALYTSSATLSAATTAYTTTNEVSGTGYTAGGATIAATLTTGGTVAYIDFANAAWTSSTITARGALIYNSTNGNKAVAVIDFGSDYTTSNGTFTIVFPAAAATTAIIRMN